VAQVQRQHDVGGARVGLLGHGREPPDLREQRDQARVTGQVGEPGEAVEQVARPLPRVGDVRRERVRVQAQPVDVHRRDELRRVEHREQRGHPAVGHHHVPDPVDDQGREGLVTGQDVPQRAAHLVQALGVEAGLGVGRGVAGGQQQGVALA